MNTERVLKQMLLVIWSAVGAAVLGAIVAGAVWVDRIAPEARGAVRSVNALLTHTDQQLNGTDAQHHTDGVIFSAKKSLDDVRAAAVIASRQERQYYTRLSGQTDLLLGNATVAVSTLNAKLAQVDTLGISADTRALLVALAGDAVGLQQVTEQLRTTIADADRQINDPALHQALAHLDGTVAGTEEFMHHLNAIIGDVQGKVHEATHPSRKARALSALLTALKTLYYVQQVVK